jgi:HlyD family secretion protein
MDLPDKSPAGGLIASVATGEGFAVSDFSPETLVAGGVEVPQDPLTNTSRTIGSATRRKRPLPHVIWSTRTNRKLSHTAPQTTAQGQETMKSRKQLASVAAIAGVGMLSLGLFACGQKPAPAEEAAVSASGSALADPGSGQSMRVTQIENRSLVGEVVATGRLVVREEAAVGSELTGYRVAAVYVDEGDWVKQGQAMAKLDDALLQAQIAQAEASLATQKANVDFKKNQLDRAVSLEKEGAFSKELLEQRKAETASAEAALLSSQAAVNEMKVREARMVLRAPVAGVVLQRTIRPGDISASVGASPYFRIASNGLIELDAELPDAKLSLMHEGTPATVTLTTGETVQGKVRFVSPRVDANTSLGRARIALPYNKSLRPGSFAEAHFNGAASDALTVLASAVRYESGGPSVMLVGDDNKVRQVPVKLGERSGDYVALVEGPPAGSRVLMVGSSFSLDGDLIQPIDGDAAPAAAPGGK